MIPKLSASLLIASLSLGLPAYAEEAPKPAPAPAVPQPAKPAVPAPAKEKLEALQGVWEGVEVGHEAEGKCVFTIVGDKIHFQRGRGNAWHKGELDFPTGAGPHEMRINIKESSAANFVGKGAAMIYQLQPDGTLSLAGGRPGEAYVPKDFAEDAHSRRFVLKKVQPKEKEPDKPAT